MDVKEQWEGLSFLGQIVVTTATVMAVLYKWVTRMVTDKVREQLAVATKSITDATSNQIDALRDELIKRETENRLHSEERTDRITSRIDDLITKIAR